MWSNCCCSNCCCCSSVNLIRSETTQLHMRCTLRGWKHPHVSNDCAKSTTVSPFCPCWPCMNSRMIRIRNACRWLVLYTPNVTRAPIQIKMGKPIKMGKTTTTPTPIQNRLHHKLGGMLPCTMYRFRSCKSVPQHVKAQHDVRSYGSANKPSQILVENPSR